MSSADSSWAQIPCGIERRIVEAVDGALGRAWVEERLRRWSSDWEASRVCLCVKRNHPSIWALTAIASLGSVRGHSQATGPPVEAGVSDFSWMLSLDPWYWSGTQPSDARSRAVQSHGRRLGAGVLAITGRGRTPPGASTWRAGWRRAGALRSAWRDWVSSPEHRVARRCRESASSSSGR